jgi:hypothetical protein
MAKPIFEDPFSQYVNNDQTKIVAGIAGDIINKRVFDL